MKIAVYNERQHRDALEKFFNECGVVNNESMDALGFENKPNALLFLVMDGQKIVNTSYVHDFSEYYPKSYRVFTRTATLPEYRGRGFPKQKSMVSAAGLAAQTCPMQVDYAMLNGADKVFFTTNSIGGMNSSQKLGRFLELVEPRDPRFSFYDEAEIYGCQQKVWQLHYRDIVKLKDPI